MAGRFARPLAGALGAVPLLAAQRPRWLSCEDEKKKAPAFQTAKCVKNEAHTHNTRLITLSLPSDWTTKGCIANVAVKATDAAWAETEKDSTVIRPYNPLSVESGSKVTLLVKQYPDGKMGTKLHNLKVGDEIEVKGPNQQWTFEKGKYSQYAMVAGGTGITPLIQAAEHILHNDAAAKVTMLTFNKTTEHVLLRKRLAQLEVSSGGRFKVYHVVEQYPGVGELEGIADSEEVLAALLPKPGPGVLVMVCGRPPMTAAVAGPKTQDWKQGEVAGVLKKLGFDSSQVWKV